MAKKTQNLGGRKKGMGKEVINARRILRTQDDLETEISKDVMAAYSTIRETMYDKSAPPATRRSAANDIIAMFDKLHAKSEKVVEEFEGRYSEENPSDDAPSDGKVQPIFKFAD